MRRLGLSILPIAFVVTLFAQEKPDFSGRWVLSPSAVVDRDVPQSLTVKQVVARTNVFEDITIVREFADHARTDTYQIGIVGGTIGGVSRLLGRPVTETRFSVQWDANRLVFKTSSDSEVPGQTQQHSEHTEIWQLAGDGTLIMAVTDRSSSVEPASKVLTYRKD